MRSIIIDLSKAFAKLSFDIILQKLKYYGIIGEEFLLLPSGLKNRKQYVIFNNHESSVTEILMVYHKDQYWVFYCLV